MSWEAILLIAVAGWFGFKLVQGFRGTEERRRYCPHCGTVDVPVRESRGSFGLEVVLWLCFLVPGIIYSVWRMNSYYDACRKCKRGAPGLVAQLRTRSGQRDLGPAGGLRIQR